MVNNYIKSSEKIKSNYIIVQNVISYNVVHTFFIKITLESHI